jgi:hypothetical protein
MRSPIFTMGPWDADHGDPRNPRELAGAAVVEVICTRDDPPAALVMLADGRYAVTGDRLAVGSARQLKRYVWRQLRHGGSEAERVWCKEIADELARRSPRPFRLVGIGGLGRARTNSRPSRRLGAAGASKVRPLPPAERLNGHPLRTPRAPRRHQELPPGPGDVA